VGVAGSRLHLPVPAGTSTVSRSGLVSAVLPVLPSHKNNRRFPSDATSDVPHAPPAGSSRNAPAALQVTSNAPVHRDEVLRHLVITTRKAAGGGDRGGAPAPSISALFV
jgi:hypothetical protein